MPTTQIKCILCGEPIGEVESGQTGAGNDTADGYCSNCVGTHLQSHFPAQEEQKEGSSG